MRGMNAATLSSIIPPAARVPSDFIFLLTYCAGPEVTIGEMLCEEAGMCDGSTMVDDLA